MNGKEMLESMGYVDEKYIAEAEDAPKRRLHWQPLAAAAACLTLVLAAGVWQFRPALKREQTDQSASAVMAAGTARSVEEAAVVNNTFSPMAASAPVQMTVRVVKQSEQALVCIVTDPGTSDYQVDDQVKIALPEDSQEETAAQPAALDAEAEPLQYEVTFLPDQGSDTITPIQWILLKDNE